MKLSQETAADPFLRCVREKVARVVKMPIAHADTGQGGKTDEQCRRRKKKKKKEENLGVNPRPLNLQ